MPTTTSPITPSSRATEPSLWKRLLPGVAALALLLSLLAPVGARAAAPGVVMDRFPDSEQAYLAVEQSKAKYVRAWLNWSDFELTPGTINAAKVYDYTRAIDRLRSAGVKVVLVLGHPPAWATGSSDSRVTPSDPLAYASFVRSYASFARRIAGTFSGRVAAWEIWNEEDEPLWWAGAPDPARYAQLLTAAYPAVKAGDANAKVILGGLTGNDYGYLDAIYDNGGRGSFDAVAVHTDIGCEIGSPYRYYRDPNGRIGRWPFLGYRSVRQSMVDHGDADKTVWMTELGWTTDQSPCSSGAWAGQRPTGVSEADQARFLSQAYHCMAQDPYVEVGTWFSLHDVPGVHQYGLLRSDLSPKPSLAAMAAYATQGDRLSEPCGDFSPPQITIERPTPLSRFSTSLVVRAVASDPSGVHRLGVLVDGARVGGWVRDAPRLAVTLKSAKRLAPGLHTITIRAIDGLGQAADASVQVRKVAAKPPRRARPRSPARRHRR